MPLLEFREITKEFTGTRALNCVSFQLDAGEVAGLIGENGAGKSTLIKILAGVHQPDSGTIVWQGSPHQFLNPHAALSAGIATIHQELAYFEKLTVAENLLMGELWPRLPWGGVDWRRLNDIATARLRSCELDIKPETVFQTLSPAQRQEVAIARALSRDAKLLILDEPSASLTEPEVARLIAHLARLKQKGVAILYVSHRLDEVLQLTDRVIVLRDGNLAAQYATKDASIERMVRDMAGRELAALNRREALAPGPVVFSASNLSRGSLFQNITFDVHAGEIVGLAGLIGAGRSELARAIFGLYGVEHGSMRIGDKPFMPSDPADARRRGIAYLPEERKRQGLVLDHSLRSAISIGFMESLNRLGWIFARRERQRVDAAVQKFRIKARTSAQPVGSLSGGNQQKALLARCLETGPRFIILDEPTRGVDVGAKAEIHTLISKTAAQGGAILLISSDLPELLALSDRIVVIHRGKISAEFRAGETSREEILFAASGFREARARLG